MAQSNGAQQQLLNAAAQNPQVQEELQRAAVAKAGEVASAAGEYAKAAGKATMQNALTYIQSGPAGVSVLCFFSGGATAVIGALNIINIFGALTSPFTYLLNSYLCIFGVVGFLLEVDVERVKSMPGLSGFASQINDYHELVCEHAKFLTFLKGRGAFYIFVGSFAITQMSLLLIAIGLANLFCGVICVLMGFGHSGEDITNKLKSGYTAVSSGGAATVIA